MRIFEILNKDEQLIFDSPVFTDAEQKRYFALSKDIVDWLKTVSSPTYMVGFVLLLGYARCKSKFFQPNMFYNADIKFICDKLKIKTELIDFTTYNSRTFNFHKQKAKSYIKLQPIDNTVFEASIYERIARSESLKQIIYEVSDILNHRLIEVPNYNKFALTISNVSWILPQNQDKKFTRNYVKLTVNGK